MVNWNVLLDQQQPAVSLYEQHGGLVARLVSPLCARGRPTTASGVLEVSISTMLVDLGGEDDFLPGAVLFHQILEQHRQDCGQDCLLLWERLFPLPAGQSWTAIHRATYSVAAPVNPPSSS